MTPRTTFRPFIDPDSRPENNHDSKPRRVLFGSATQEEEYFDEQEEEEEGRAHTPEYEEGVIELRTPGADQNDENVGPSYRARYAADIDIMTPIAERTFEVTTTSSLPSAFKIKDATVAAMQLAAELRQEEEQELGQQEPLRYAADAAYPSQHPMDEDEEDEDHFMTDDPMLQDTESRTGSLSLFDAMDVASSFRPPNPCTPFDPSIASTLLSLLPANSAFHDYRNEEAVQLADLQKFCKKQERRGNSSSSSSSDRYPLPLGNVQYEVLSKLGEGGFGAVFAAEDITLADDDPDEVIPVAIKVVRPKNLWEFHVLHNLRSSLPPDLRTSIIEPHALFAFRDESFLILEMCSRGTLLDLVNRVHEINVGQKGACLDELLVVFFTIELLRLLEGMHARGFIHGDLKIDNCLLRLEDVPRGSSAWSSAYHPDGSGGWNYKGIKLIDFGRTIDTRQFPKGQQFVADWPTDVRDCREMREGEPWSYQPDYFGLAGIVYCMLYGRYFDEKSVIEAQEGAYKLNASFKRYWQVDLWTELFDLLLNPTLVRPGGQLPLCAELASIRLKFEEWLQKNDRGVARSLQGLIKKVAIASERG
jgi:checkpoint serine/threonine-protein kinase